MEEIEMESNPRTSQSVEKVVDKPVEKKLSKTANNIEVKATYWTRYLALRFSYLRVAITLLEGTVFAHTVVLLASKFDIILRKAIAPKVFIQNDKSHREIIQDNIEEYSRILLAFIPLIMIFQISSNFVVWKMWVDSKRCMYITWWLKFLVCGFYILDYCLLQGEVYGVYFGVVMFLVSAEITLRRCFMARKAIVDHNHSLSLNYIFRKDTRNLN